MENELEELARKRVQARLGLASRDLPRGTPVDETYDAGVICLPFDSKLHHAAAFVARVDVRRIVVCRNREAVGLIGGLDLARIASRRPS